MQSKSRVLKKARYVVTSFFSCLFSLFFFCPSVNSVKWKECSQMWRWLSHCRQMVLHYRTSWSILVSPHWTLLSSLPAAWITMMAQLSLGRTSSPSLLLWSHSDYAAIHLKYETYKLTYLTYPTCCGNSGLMCFLKFFIRSPFPLSLVRINWGKKRTSCMCR